MAKKQELLEQPEVSRTEGLEELMNILKKDEEILKQNLIGMNSQLQYNQGVQRTIQQLIGKLLNAAQST